METLDTPLGEHPWSVLLPLILDHVGSILECECMGDVLRARLVCKHWYACLTRCVTRLTLYGRAVPLPTVNTPGSQPPPLPAALNHEQSKWELQQRQHEHQQKALSANAGEALSPSISPPGRETHPVLRYGRHVHLIPSFAPTIRHVTIRGEACDIGGLHAIVHSLPGLTSLSLAIATSYPSSLTPLLQLVQPPPGGGSAEMDASAATAAAARGHAAATGPGAAIGFGLPPFQGPYWPPAPPRLEKLWIRVHAGVPSDVLYRLLLQPPRNLTTEQQQQQHIEASVVPSACLASGSSAFLAPISMSMSSLIARDPWTVSAGGAAAAPSVKEELSAVVSLRELALLPQLGRDGGWVTPGPAQQVPYVDLSPLLDPRLAGVTCLVVPAMTNRPDLQPQAQMRHNHHHHHHQQQQQQQQQHPGVAPVQGHQPGAGPADVTRTVGITGALGVEDVLGRLTQLRSLTVLAQVELASFYPACLAALTGLRALHLPKGVYCEGSMDLRQLTGLSLLTSLELNFESEWWIYAGDLCVLSRMSYLRQLKLSLDYGLETGYAMSEDELAENMYVDDMEGEAEWEDIAPWREAGADAEVEAEVDAGPPTETQAEGIVPGRDPGAALMSQQRQEATQGGGRYETLEELTHAMAVAWVCTRGAARRSLREMHGDPGITDDWRAPLGCLTQLRRLELQMVNGGGRHLAEALHAVTWLRTAAGSSISAGADAFAGGSGAGAGAWLALRDAPAAAFLNLPYWYKVASGATTASTTAVASSSSVSFPMLVRSPQARHLFLAPPLMSLQLGAGRALRLLYGHILCLGLMTDLRSLDLSFEVAAPSITAGFADDIPGAATGNALESYFGNPLLALRRLRRLHELRVGIKQRWTAFEMQFGAGSSGGGGGSSGGDGSGASGRGEGRGDAALMVAAPMDDAVLQAWLEGMPSLQTMVLQGVGRLGESALAALGRHGSLRSLELRLKVLTSSADSALRKHVARGSPAGLQSGCVGSGGINGNDSSNTDGDGIGSAGSTLRIGYGSYYGLRTAWAVSHAAADGAGGGGGSLFCSSSVTPMGTSPKCPSGYMSMMHSPGWGPPTHHHKHHHSVEGALSGSLPAPMQVGSFGASAAERSSETGPTGRSREWRERVLAAGIEGSPELLADVPYFVRPHHLPPSLTSLDLTNAAFSAEWAHINSEVALLASSPSDPSVTTTCAVQSSGGRSTSNDPRVDTAEGMDRRSRPVPRLRSLKLTRKLPKHRRLLQERSAAKEVAEGTEGAVAASPLLDPTRLTDWHLVYLTACQPTLAHFELNDTDGGSGAGDVAKFHQRALAQLGRLSFLESLTLKVGNRLRWRAQEALFATAPVGLRSLHLYAAHVYREALEMATRLVHLSSLQVVGYTEPGYANELHSAGDLVIQHLPACSLLQWFRDVDEVLDPDEL